MNEKPKRAFSTAFKLQVIVDANVTSTGEQARIHNIDEKIIRRWCQFWDPLLKPSNNPKSFELTKNRLKDNRLIS